MNENPNENERPLTWDRQSPDRLMRLFTDTPALKWLAVSIVAHLLILGITSLGYIRDRWIDPEGAVARAAAAKAAAVNVPPPEAAAPQAGAPQAGATPEGASTGAPPESAATPAAQGPRTEAQLLEDRKNAPVVQRITDTAAPQEIPRQPDELGLSLEDTRR